MIKKAFLTTLPNFIETQCSSFCWFLSTGLIDSLNILKSNLYQSDYIDFDYFCENYFFVNSDTNDLKSHRYSTTLTIKVYVPISIIFKTKINTIKSKIIDHTLLFLGEIPLMTNRGTFLINGYEKICINHLIRSPGIYFSKEIINTKINKQRALLLPQRGAWISFEISNQNFLTILLDKGEQIDFIDFLYFFYLSSKEISSYFSLSTIKNSFNLKNTLYANKKKNNFKTTFQTKILNKTFYSLGIIGRLNLNNRLNKTNSPVTKLHLTLSDFFNIIDYFYLLTLNNGPYDDMDHLNNKSIRSIGEILQFQIQFGIKRIQREFTKIFYNNEFNLHELTFYPSKVFSLVLITFFSSSQLIQFLDQTNVLSELAQKRRLTHSQIGTNSTNVNLKMRDIHSSYFGRICPIETAEGSNAGLTSALTSYSRINSLGIIETPFFIVNKGYVLTKYPVIYLTAYEEYFFTIAPSDTKLTISEKINENYLMITFQNKYIMIPSISIKLMAVSSLQFFSLGVSLIPFMEHNDANRILMGANMQRQAVPLLYSHKPIIGTGLEMQLASTLALKSYVNGFIKIVTSKSIIIRSLNLRLVRYFLKKFKRSNQNTCFNQRAIVWRGEFIQSGQILADNSDTENGELALGQNLLIAYMSWNGFNFEDAILINERLIFADLFTSITILNFNITINYTSTNSEQLYSNFSANEITPFKNLDSNGLIKKGSFVKPFDILVGKLTPGTSIIISNFVTLVNMTTPSKNTLKNSSILATSNCYGRVLDCTLYSHENTLNLSNLIRFKIIIILAQLRKLQVGDKLSGRHGNKGIISKILAQEDMPYLPNGQSIDLVLNPLGVPSRMNVGQLFEGLLGLAGNFLNKRFKISPFDEVFKKDASRILITKYLQKVKQYTNLFWIYNQFTPGKIILYDGKTGNSFDNSILVCKSYILKLIHFVVDKLQARSTGPYSLISQQPLHGKVFKGGQRFGEMEVWALEAFGAAYTLQEILTLKSDGIIGRDHIITAILTNTSFLNNEIPVSFKILILELKALGLNINIYKINKEIIPQLNFKNID